MHKKKYNNNVTQKFIQGLRPFSTTLPQQIKKILKKNGFNLSSLVDNWTKIVGKNISDNCYPINVKAQKSSKEICLILNVIRGKEVDVEYNKKNIIDKINSHFGYNYISQIKLKIMDSFHNAKKKIKKNSKSKENLIKKLENINNHSLKNKLNKLIDAYNDK